jgi:hypothetical protein
MAWLRLLSVQTVHFGFQTGAVTKPADKAVIWKTAAFTKRSPFRAIYAVIIIFYRFPFWSIKRAAIFSIQSKNLLSCGGKAKNEALAILPDERPVFCFVCDSL